MNVRYDVDGSTYNPLVHGFIVLFAALGLIIRKRGVAKRSTVRNIESGTDD